ncbi:hypothetical protein [Pseudoalteromonas sp. MMG022]|uniref:hypothetical protein n=1 Tax=Pseudoalteromonas sp. MMG022 TaxID=2909978 RepID=UPI001F3039F4|nr:hypothetical protein [Pseudoalteromonas sp. MMG022]MCF6435852.1 hypothetical protein [Pseudoalteromonas sp. MMG022]
MLIRALRSQFNLKPHFYAKSFKVGVIGCLLGIYPAYYLMLGFAAYLGVDNDVPLQHYEQTAIMAFFICCLSILTVCAYVFCVLTALLYYGTKYKKGYISKSELIDIAFKGLYPQHWLKDS